MPILVPPGTPVYTIDEINAYLNSKADKVAGAGALDIALLTGSEGNLFDSGMTLDDIVTPDVIDAGTF